MSIMSPSKIACLFILMSFVAAPVCAGDKEDKEKLDRLSAKIEEVKTEMSMLEHRMQSLCDAINRAGGVQRGLITQIIRNTSAIRRSQLTVSTNSKDAATQIASIGERITATNEQLERLSEQFAALKKLIEDVPKQPAFAQITPGDPKQLFAVAYSDYSRGANALALSEFRQYVGIYPDSALTDNAEYWIGEILYAQKKYQDAVDAFMRVFDISPKGDKAAIALYKRALADEIAKATSTTDSRTLHGKRFQAESLRRELRNKAEDAEQGFMKRLQQVLDPIEDDLRKAIGSYAGQRGISLVIDLDRARDLILYMAESANVTQDFINEYNRCTSSTTLPIKPSGK